MKSEDHLGANSGGLSSTQQDGTPPPRPRVLAVYDTRVFEQDGTVVLRGRPRQGLQYFEVFERPEGLVGVTGGLKPLLLVKRQFGVCAHALSVGAARLPRYQLPRVFQGGVGGIPGGGVRGGEGVLDRGARERPVQRWLAEQVRRKSRRVDVTVNVATSRWRPGRRRRANR